MKHNPNGFTLVESLATLSIFLMITLTIVPILYQITLEEEVLKQRRMVQSFLHDELLDTIASSIPIEFPISFNKRVNNGPEITFEFVTENNLLKGCANWNNVKKIQETICLYGYSG